MKYFINVVNFVDKHLFWVVMMFLAACAVELIVFLCKKKGGNFDTDGFFVCIVSNLLGTLALYVLACLCVGMINCLRDQDWHFWSNYMKFLKNSASIVIFSLVFVAACIFFLFKFRYDIDSFVARLIVSVLAGALTGLVSVIVGFIIYVVIAIVIVILKVLWFVVSGFFLSIFQFVVKYWKMSVIALVGPGVIYGMCCAFANYIKSFKNEVIHN